MRCIFCSPEFLERVSPVFFGVQVSRVFTLVNDFVSVSVTLLCFGVRLTLVGVSRDMWGSWEALTLVGVSLLGFGELRGWE